MNPNSEMEQLEPIPSPPGHLFREFCHRALPVLAFVGAGIAVATLWSQRFNGALLSGEVEPIRANVTTLEAGTLTRLHVERWQEVTNGQLVATIQVLDPDAIGRSIEILRNELYVLRSRMALDETRNEQDLEGLRVRWLEARVNLATARVSLENAARESERSRRLFAENIVSQAALENAESIHAALVAEVEERSRLVSGLEISIQRLESSSQKGRNESLDLLSRSLSAQERQLQNEGHHELRAPRSGIVKTINGVAGERIPASTIIAVIASPTAERIVGYVRQPISINPQPGMKVEIRTRGPVRQSTHAEITHVGSDLELVASPLRLRGFDNGVEHGLAFSVPIPPDLKVRPGELVDLIVHQP